MGTNTPSTESNGSMSAVLWKAVIRFFLLMAFMFTILFLAAGRIDWWEAWAYVIQGLIIMVVSRAILIAKHPDTALERAEANKKEDVKPWDRILMPVTALYGPMVSWVLAGLDKRFGWSPDLPDAIQWIALAVIFLGGVIGSWAMISNRFFSSQVRIQTDRGHTVVDQGPYQIVRHPGYAGGILSWIAAPVFFGSYSVGVIAILVLIASFVRTALEDRMLQGELPGYKAYAEKVRYRLIPGIW
jgi:protein-S-isoprenylcysteine O-methyltransferase Ste14